MHLKIRKKFVRVGVSANVENALVKSLVPRELFMVNTVNVIQIYVQREAMECHAVAKNMAIAYAMVLVNALQECLLIIIYRYFSLFQRSFTGHITRSKIKIWIRSHIKGWEDEQCSCSTDDSLCVNPAVITTDGSIPKPCSGHGDCKCGECECWELGEKLGTACYMFLWIWAVNLWSEKLIDSLLWRFLQWWLLRTIQQPVWKTRRLCQVYICSLSQFY